MLDVVFELLRAKDVCVLATVNGEKPHCSLMSYVPDAECRHLFMATRTDTRKWRNVLGNPHVSLLIDTRDEDSSDDRLKAKALTVTGRRETLTGARKAEALALLGARHGHLSELLQDPLTEVIDVRCKSFLLLEGISTSHYIEIPD